MSRYDLPDFSDSEEEVVPFDLSLLDDDGDDEDVSAFNTYGSFAEMLQQEGGPREVLPTYVPRVIHNRTEFFAQSSDLLPYPEDQQRPIAATVPLTPLGAGEGSGSLRQATGLMLGTDASHGIGAVGEGDTGAVGTEMARPVPVRSQKRPATAPRMPPIYESEVEAVLQSLGRMQVDAVQLEVQGKWAEMTQEEPKRMRREKETKQHAYATKMNAVIESQRHSIVSCLDDFASRQAQSSNDSRSQLEQYRETLREIGEQKSAAHSLVKSVISAYADLSKALSTVLAVADSIRLPSTTGQEASSLLTKCEKGEAELVKRKDVLVASLADLQDMVGADAILYKQQAVRKAKAEAAVAQAATIVKQVRGVCDEKVTKDRALAADRAAKQKALDEAERVKQAAAAEAAKKKQATEAAAVAAKAQAATAAREKAVAAKQKAAATFTGTKKLEISAQAFAEYKEYTKAYVAVQDAPRNIQCMKPIKLVFNQVNNEKAHTEQRALALCSFFDTVKNDPPRMAYCYKFFADQLVTKAEDAVSSKEQTYILAYLALCIISRYPGFGKVLLGKMYICCPYAVPLYMKREGFDSDEAYESAQGYSKGMTEQKYLKRMEGIVQILGGLHVLAVPLKMDGENSLFGMAAAWKLLARYGNMESRIHTPRMLLCLLQVMGFSMAQRYGKQFQKLVVYFGTSFFSRALAAGKEVDKPSVTRFKGFLEAYDKNRGIKKFPGHDSFH